MISVYFHLISIYFQLISIDLNLLSNETKKVKEKIFSKGKGKGNV